MKTHLFATAAALTLSAVVAPPAAAQASVIGVTEPSAIVAGSTALQTAYQQIGTTFQAQLTQLEGLQQQRETLMQAFDTDQDGQLSDAEQAAAQADTARVGQVQALESQIAQVGAPVTQARMYAMEQIMQQLNPALQQVITQKGIQLIVAPTATVWVGDAADVTDDISAALNQLVPSVSTTVPANWQPQRRTVQMYQQVQNLLVQAAMLQAQQQQAAAPQQAPQGR